MDISDTIAKIHYLTREQFYNSILTVCKTSIHKNQDTVVLRLYSSVALVLYDRITEGVNELQSLRSESSIQLAVIISLMYANKMKTHKSTNKEAQIELETQLKEARKSASSYEFYQAAVILFMLEKYKKALDFVEKSLNLEPKHEPSLCLKGWTNLYLFRLNTSTPNCKPLQCFEQPRSLDAHLGLAESYLSENRHEEALTTLNKAIVRFPSTSLPLIQKMKTQLATQDWEQAVETMNRIVMTDPSNLEAMQTNILVLICNDGNYDEAAQCVQKFCQTLDTLEPQNAKLLIKNALLFSRSCGRNVNILTETYKMVERAVQISPNNADYINELGYQCLLQEKIREAVKHFKSATKISDTSVNALIGLTLCEYLQNGKTEQTRQQIEFLLELDDQSPVLLVIQAKLAPSADDAFKLLNQAVEKQIESFQNYPYGAEYLLRLNADFLLDVVKEYTVHVSSEQNFLGSERKMNERCMVPLNTLKIITKACPGLQEAMYLLAKLQYSNGEINDAMAHLERILSSATVTFYESYLLMAQIQLDLGFPERAAQNLELCLSHNFNVRNNPLYYYLLGMARKQNGDSSEAVEFFNNALALLKVKSQEQPLSVADKAAIYTELIQTHLESNTTENLERLLQEASQELQGTKEENKVVMLNADIALHNGNVKRAIDLLSSIKPTDACYVQAKRKLAGIFLNDTVDKKSYIKCYEDLVQTNPTSETHILLADAYMEVLDTERAIESYKHAVSFNPKDPQLLLKYGEALFLIHDFSGAEEFFKNAIRETGNAEIKLHLADVYLKLKRYSEAEKLLVNEVESEKRKAADDVVALKYKTRLLMLLATVYDKSGNVTQALSSLRDARDTQLRIKKWLILEGASATDEMNKLVDIDLKLAELCVLSKEYEQAVDHYKDALSVVANDVKTLELLAKLYMQMNYLELCQQTCVKLLELDADNEAAAVLMADIAFRKVDFDMAVFHFTQVVTKNLTNWTTFVKFIEIMRRTGNLSDVENFLQQAKRLDENSTGFSYCKGLYEWYSGNLNVALKHFNNARQDPQWRQDAVYNMIEICLNPNDEMLGEQLSDFGDPEYKDSRSLALKTAERLLRELKQVHPKDTKELRYRLLGNFILLATKDKSKIEYALDDFISLASQDEYRDYVGPILGVATAHTMLKQNQRAKNQLKRVAKNVWTFEDAEYLERCWLLLADYYIQSAKYDLAFDLLRKVLQYNRMSVRAYELSGTIAEKEQRYKDAANYFESAWKFSGNSNPFVGYKAAYNFMKSKKYVNAIDICQQVLKFNPDYPRIKKDILDKSVSNLRT